MQEILDTIARLIEQRTKEAEEAACAAMLADVIKVVNEFRPSCSCVDRIYERIAALSPTPNEP